MSGFNINSLTLSGTLTRDPELRTTGGGTSVCSMRLAYNTRRKNANGDWEDQPNFIDLTAWSGLGEWYARNLAKGATVVVHGELRWREWQDKEGNTRQSYDLNVDSLIPMRENGGGGGGFNQRPEARSDVPSDTRSFEPVGASPSSGDEDIPF